MKFSISTLSPEQLKLDALVLNIFEGDENLPPRVAQIDQALDSVISQGLKNGEIKAKLFESTLIYTFGKITPKKVLVLGSGKSSEFDSAKLTKLAAFAGRTLAKKGITQAGLCISTPKPDLREMSLMVEGLLTGVFDPAIYVSKKEDVKDLSDVVFNLDVPTSEKVEAEITNGVQVGECINWARRLVAEPANILTPQRVVEEAKSLATEFDLEIEVLDEKQAREKGMGAFCAIASGSDEPSFMVKLAYHGAKSPKKSVLGLVGKGVTFDSGGISIKPSDKMEEMKMDMAGAATVLSAMRLVAMTKPNIDVVGVMPITENLPSGKSVRPGDVVKAMNGKTIEVINTDAEGRVVLADALLWSQEMGITHLIDLATLTGAVISALGYEVSGVMGNNQEWLNKIIEHANKAGEKMWQLPSFDLYKELLKSSIADYANVPSSRQAGSIAGAMFLSEFVAPGIPWVHIDIGGTAWLNSEKPYMAKGPTGVGLKTISSLINEVATN